MFVNQTQNNLETNLAANLHIAKPYKIVFLCVFCPLFLLLGVMCLLIDPSDLVMPIFLIAMAVVFALFYLVFFKKILIHTIKKMLQGKEGVNTFTFEDDGFTVQTETNAGLSGSSTGVYGSLSKAVEYDDMWLLYYNRATVFTVCKSGMKEGSAEDFSVFLGVKLGERLRVKTKKTK